MGVEKGIRGRNATGGLGSANRCRSVNTKEMLRETEGGYMSKKRGIVVSLRGIRPRGRPEAFLGLKKKKKLQPSIVS